MLFQTYQWNTHEIKINNDHVHQIQKLLRKEEPYLQPEKGKV